MSGRKRFFDDMFSTGLLDCGHESYAQSFHYTKRKEIYNLVVYGIALLKLQRVDRSTGDNWQLIEIADLLASKNGVITVVQVQIFSLEGINSRIGPVEPDTSQRNGGFN